MKKMTTFLRAIVLGILAVDVWSGWSLFGQEMTPQQK